MKWIYNLLGKKSLSEIARGAVEAYGAEDFTFDTKGDAILITDTKGTLSATLSKEKGEYLIERSHGDDQYIKTALSAEHALETYFCND